MTGDGFGTNYCHVLVEKSMCRLKGWATAYSINVFKRHQYSQLSMDLLDDEENLALIFRFREDFVGVQFSGVWGWRMVAAKHFAHFSNHPP